MDENYSKLVEQLRKRVTAIEQLSSRLYKAGIIPRRTFSDITLGNKSISEKAEILMSSTVEYLKFGPSHDSNGRFSQVIMSFKESKLTPIAEILTNSLGKNKYCKKRVTQNFCCTGTSMLPISELIHFL